jgi:hypothetical protein
MRLDHGPQRRLLQVPELRLVERLQLIQLIDPAAAVLSAPELSDPVRNTAWPATVT